MGQNFYSPEEIDLMLEVIKSHQRKELLLRIDEILATLDTASPAVGQWKNARRVVQMIERGKFAAMAGSPVGAAHVDSVLSCN